MRNNKKRDDEEEEEEDVRTEEKILELLEHKKIQISGHFHDLSQNIYFIRSRFHERGSEINLIALKQIVEGFK